MSATRFVAGFSITYYSILICSNVSLECIHSLARILNRWFVVQFGTNLCNLEQIELDQQITLAYTHAISELAQFIPAYTQNQH